MGKTNSKLETRVEGLVEELDKKQPFSALTKDFPFGFASCLKEIAESGNKQLFQRLADSYVSYSQKINQRILSSEQIRLEALDFLEYQCMIADTGKMFIGIPGRYKISGLTRNMFLDIYLGQLARDNDYAVTHSIKISNC